MWGYSKQLEEQAAHSSSSGGGTGSGSGSRTLERGKAGGCEEGRGWRNSCCGERKSWDDERIRRPSKLSKELASFDASRI